MDLSIIIVNWNSLHYLKKCIASILSQTRFINYEIVVIDNASFDGTDEELRRHYPEVRFIQSSTNLGFARANNEAFKISVGRNILFLNPDTEIKNNALGYLMKCLDTEPEVGVVGAKLFNSDGSVQRSCIRVFPTILNCVADFDWLMEYFPRSRLWGTAPLFIESNLPSSIEAVSGACLMVKRSSFERVGMFSTDYFMYSEDIDLCYKIKQAGELVYFMPGAHVIHHGGGSSSQSGVSTFSTVMLHESRWRFFKKTRSIWYCNLYRFFTLGMGLLRLALIQVIRPFLGRMDRSRICTKVSAKWMANLRWAIGLEKWVKNY